MLHPKDREQTKKWIEQYINKHLILKTPANTLSLKVIGFENEEEALWTYVESSECQPVANLVVENSFLLELLPEQNNIVQLEVSGKSINYKLSKAEQSHTFLFK